MIPKFVGFSYFILLVLVSHWVLPSFNQSQDFLFFSTWKLFSTGPRTQVVDISWDGGNTYLLRDYNEQLNKTNIDRIAFYDLIKAKSGTELKSKFGETLRVISKTSDLEFHVLEGSLTQHILLKQKLEILEITRI